MKRFMFAVLTLFFIAGFSTTAMAKDCYEVTFDKDGNPQTKKIECPPEPTPTPDPTPEPSPEPTPGPDASKAGKVECHMDIVDKKGVHHKRMIKCPKSKQKKGK